MLRVFKHAQEGKIKVMKEYLNITSDEERALYGISDALVQDCVFAGEADGESALKETSGLNVKFCDFHLRYPMWHMSDSTIEGCTLTETCRAPLWYGKNLKIFESEINGTKAVRECDNVYIGGCNVSSEEFGWLCRGLKWIEGKLNSSYPFLMSKNLYISDFELTGKYSFQYVEDSKISDSILNTKDAFWHSKNVKVVNCVLNGEYLGWYSENLHLVRCKIIGTQPFCYCKGLVLENCEMIDTDLAFENSEVQAELYSGVQSIKNPKSGRIRAVSYGDIILDAPTECEILTV